MTSHLRSMLSKSGVTLLEAVFTIIMAAILAAIMINFFGYSVAKSTDPINKLKHSLYLNQVMEAVLNDYNDQLATASNPLTALANIKSRIAANKYGTDYTVVFNDFIVFNDPTVPGPETITEKSGSPTVNDILKVTLKSDTGETLTELFAAVEK